MKSRALNKVYFDCSGPIILPISNKLSAMGNFTSYIVFWVLHFWNEEVGWRVFSSGANGRGQQFAELQESKKILFQWFHWFWKLGCWCQDQWDWCNIQKAYQGYPWNHILRRTRVKFYGLRFSQIYCRLSRSSASYGLIILCSFLLSPANMSIFTHKLSWFPRHVPLLRLSKTSEQFRPPRNRDQGSLLISRAIKLFIFSPSHSRFYE